MLKSHSRGFCFISHTIASKYSLIEEMKYFPTQYTKCILSFMEVCQSADYILWGERMVPQYYAGISYV